MTSATFGKQVSAVADGVLDALIVPSFTKIGPAIRSRLFEWTEPEVAGRKIALTGPTSGLGKAAALRLAELGAELVLIARNPTKLASLVEELEHVGAGPFTSIVMDLSDFDSVAEAGDQLLGMDHLDTLIHNGGALHNTRQTVTGPAGDELELTLATHVVAPFLLTAKAVPALSRGQDSRIVTMSSGGMYGKAVDLGDMQTTSGYTGTLAYAKAKRMQVDLTGLWAERLKAAGVSVHAMHPGWAATPGVSDALPGFDKLLGPLLRTPAEGADTLIWLCGASPDEIGTDGFWLDRRRRPDAYLPGTRTSKRKQAELWEAINELAGSPLDSVS